MLKLKQMLLTAWSCLLILSSVGQISTSHNLIRIETPKYNLNLSDPYYIYVPMDFNNAEVREKVKRLDPGMILSITLIYSQYRASDRFNQLQLNNERTQALMEIMPFIKGEKEIKWYWVAQTACHSPEACKGYFHGFEIRLYSKEELLTRDISTARLDYYMDLYRGLDAKSAYLDSLSRLTETRIIKVCDTTYVEHYRVPNRLGYLKELHKRSKKKFLKKLNRDITLEGSEIVMTIDNRKRVTSVSGVREKDKFLKHLNKYYHATTTRIKGERIYTHYTLILKRNATGKVVDFTALAKPMDADGTLLEFAPYDIIYAERVICDYIDTTVSVERSVVHNDVITRVLDRNEQWKNCLVVTDVTGSMLPYMGQFLVWHQLNLKTGAKNIDFVLFNDGNNMKDALKVVGSTGGIYYIHTDKFHELKKEVNYAQHNGSGGDREENNIEAALYGIKMNPSASAIIMIADNNATPRDLELLSEVNKPIHVILCGAENGINVEYLDLVRKNGGSLHTIEDDIENLAAMNEGEEIEIEGRSYRIEDGKFVLLHDKTIAD